MKDELKKLGLRVRKQPASKPQPEKPGKIVFDELGNAVFEWGEDCLTEDSDTGERLRSRALAYAGLAIVEDDAPLNAPVRPNPKGLRMGYNPYESGLLAKQQRGRKLDLEQLSKTLELQRKLKDGPPE